jgi:hypothetical protein
VLDYETPDPQDAVPFINAMRFWRIVAAYSFVPAPLGLFVYHPILLLALLTFAVGIVLTLTYMTRAAIAEAGPTYAVRHLVLAIVLTPALFAGPFLVSRLVEADLVNWRLAQRPADVIPPSPLPHATENMIREKAQNACGRGLG